MRAGHARQASRTACAPRAQVMSLPMSADLTDAQQDAIVAGMRAELAAG